MKLLLVLLLGLNNFCSVYGQISDSSQLSPTYSKSSFDNFKSTSPFPSFFSDELVFEFNVLRSGLLGPVKSCSEFTFHSGSGISAESNMNNRLFSQCLYDEFDSLGQKIQEFLYTRSSDGNLRNVFKYTFEPSNKRLIVSSLYGNDTSVVLSTDYFKLDSISRVIEHNIVGKYGTSTITYDYVNRNTYLRNSSYADSSTYSKCYVNGINETIEYSYHPRKNQVDTTVRVYNDEGYLISCINFPYEDFNGSKYKFTYSNNVLESSEYFTLDNICLSLSKYDTNGLLIERHDYNLDGRETSFIKYQYNSNRDLMFMIDERKSNEINTRYRYTYDQFNNWIYMEKTDYAYGTPSINVYTREIIYFE
ncbi:MAG: hypothetical protein QNK23_05100 [Crocinitomicaceae bacterium]|nr:hypothetical protein [Crocinitomicaceae bacterium]